MKAIAVVTTAVLLAMGPQPADAAFPGMIAAGASLIGIIGRTAGTAVREYSKRDFELDARATAPPGVPQFEYDRCYEDISGLTIEINTNNADYLEVRGLPPTCMNLANVMIGDGTGPFAIPCGSDCLFYDSITADEIVEFQDTLGI